MAEQQQDGGGFQLVLIERDDRQAIYETWVRLSTEVHGFHRYSLDTGTCERIDKPRPTSCDLSVANRMGSVIKRAIEGHGGDVPDRIEREYW